ncbi:serine/threonine-protein kinase [Actinomycetospora sp. C-140]
MTTDPGSPAPGSRPGPQPGPQPGPLPERLGQRFALGELIGRGTCSEVYRAHDLLLDRDAAVKIFPVENDPRIEREVALMASLDHPSLVPVYDVGSVDGRAFVVMALLEGGNLVDRLADGPLGVTETLLAVASVADGLAHVHRASVLHRDVTPRNVLFDADGRAHLADFGVAFVADAPRITDTGIVVGSAPYLAPEQVAGGTVGPPADVYALGLVMIEALTGRPAYDGKPLAAARARLERRPEMPPGIDIEVEALLEAMTADEPRSRPAADRVCVGLRRAALAAETLTPLRAVAPIADVGPASAVPDATTETLRSTGTGAAARGPAAATGTGGAAPVGMPGAAAAADTADPELDETPGRARRAAAGAGGLVVAASVGAAVLLASGVVVASAWTVDRVGAAAPPAATVAPPSAEVVADPGAGSLLGGGSGGGSEHRESSSDDATVSTRGAGTSDGSERRAVASTQREAPPTDGGSTERTTTTTAPTSTSTQEPTRRPSRPSLPHVTVPSVPGLPSVSLPSLPTPTSDDDETSTATHSTTTPHTTTPRPTTTPHASTTRPSTTTSRTTTTTTTTTKNAAGLDPAVEALGGLFGDGR